MQLIPVLDVRDGIVVRGVAGERSRYQPVTSRLTTSARPLEVARSLRDTFDTRAVYVADLDGLEHSQPDRDLHRTLSADGFELLLDCGVRGPDDAVVALESGAKNIVIPLETWTSADALGSLVARAGADRLVFSLDLKAGRPLSGAGDWDGMTAEAIARDVVAAGLRSLIVLDLAGVGVDGGVPTLPLCRAIRSEFPDVQVITGGGVRGRGDLQALAAAGVDGVLVASALHNGRVTPEDVAAVQAQSSAE
mgnify:CR=1 FL=1